MKMAILSANLANFDTPVDPIPQEKPKGIKEIYFHRYTDKDFPPIEGLTPRIQYRIPKLFGWEMMPGYDYYLWMDSSMSLIRPDAVKWFMDNLGKNDIALFKHPWRNSIQEETDHIEEKLQQKGRYITSRYKNGLHKEQLAACLADPGFKDKVLYTSTAFIYRNNKKVHEAMKLWWYHQSRYFTCDQIALPYVVYKSNLEVGVINENQYHSSYISMTSKHK